MGRSWPLLEGDCSTYPVDIGWVTIRKSWSLSLSLSKQLRSSPCLQPVPCQRGEMDPVSPLHTISCFCTVLFRVHFFLKASRRDTWKGSMSCSASVPNLVCSLCWSKQKHVPVTSAKPYHVLPSKGQMSSVSITFWRLPRLSMNFAEWASRDGHRHNWGHCP